jgi:hypothetical protein
LLFGTTFPVRSALLSTKSIVQIDIVSGVAFQNSYSGH